jgi:integrase
MAMRPKKPRFIDGIQLADNLYPDPRKRPGYYQYKFPDGRMSVFKASSPLEANTIAGEALEAFHAGAGPDSPAVSRSHVMFHASRYIAEMERLNPKLKLRSQWTNDCYAIKKFAREFSRLDLVSRESIQTWWDGLTYHQQHQRHASFRRWFNWMIREKLFSLDYNPFALNDSVPRLMRKVAPGKARPSLSELDYRKIHKAAGELGFEALQIAMGISLYTALREGDVCRLKFKTNVMDGQLRLVIQKSEAQLGAIGAARLCWTLDKHPRLKALIDRARELALQNKGCPFVISHTPKRRAWNEEKEHLCQVTGERLYRMFVEARDYAGATKGVTFHEVRGLASTLYRIAGYGDEQIQKLMAHEDVGTTKGYQNPDALPYEEITMKLEMDL